jgi:hypothetical protein
MYSGSPGADVLLQKYSIDYVLVSPLESGTVKVNEDFFRKFPVAASTGQSRVYKVR